MTYLTLDDETPCERLISRAYNNKTGIMTNRDKQIANNLDEIARIRKATYRFDTTSTKSSLRKGN